MSFLIQSLLTEIYYHLVDGPHNRKHLVGACCSVCVTTDRCVLRTCIYMYIRFDSSFRCMVHDTADIYLVQCILPSVRCEPDRTPTISQRDRIAQS